MADSLSDKATDAIDFLRLKAKESESEKSATSSRQALDLFSRYVGGTDISFADFDEPLLGSWAAYLLFNDYTPKTVSYYIKRLSALYTKAVESGFAQPTDAFSAIRAKLSTLISCPGSHGSLLTAQSQPVQSLQKISRLTLPEGAPLHLAREILLFSLFNGGLTSEQIVLIKKSDCPSTVSLTDPGHSASSIGNQESANGHFALSIKNSKGIYLFPLDRSNKNRRQQISLVEDLLRRILASAGVSLSTNPARTTIDLWAVAAMSCGVSPQDISSCLADKGTPEENLFTYLVPPTDISPERKEAINSQVISALTEDPAHWYVMHFRRHVDFDRIDSRLRECGLNLLETYYPMEEILRKVGGKKVFESRPVISWLLFFRQRASRLNTLFREIGDLAWGYRQSRDIRSPYAVVSDSEIAAYKMALGTLDSDTALLTPDEVQLQPGDRLIVLGGLLNGRPATFDRILRQDQPNGRIICRILLDGGKSRDWVVEQDLRLLRKIPESQFHKLTGTH